MSFRIDIQTLSDIDLFQDDDEQCSLFNFYNRTKTEGGKDLLIKIIKSPFSDRVFLDNRKAEIKYIFDLSSTLTLNKKQFDFIEFYLNNNTLPFKYNFVDAFWNKIFTSLKSSNDLYIIKEGIYHIISILRDLKAYTEKINAKTIPEPLEDEVT